MGAVHPAILISLGFCFLLLIYVILEEYIGGIIKRGLLGCVTMVVVNWFIPPYITITFNIWSIIVACLFGIPGILVMYLIKIISLMNG